MIYKIFFFDVLVQQWGLKIPASNVPLRLNLDIVTQHRRPGSSPTTKMTKTMTMFILL